MHYLLLTELKFKQPNKTSITSSISSETITVQQEIVQMAVFME